MAIYKCKMCSGELDVQEGVSVVECDFCGTKQTVPTAKDENLQALFNRANVLRTKNEFDKAEKLYEKILQADETQAEAYWGLILCKYGIEYVEDPKTFTRIPTCHRTSFDSIIADDDYKSALQYADGVQRGLYESEAKEIDRIQKDILALSQKEEPYDVFICYKETDDTGRRTQDSAIANDIYYQLTNEGFKVFYAAITLEDKLGSAYEPCIFAALNSSKVMLAVGTKPEFFNAVWVKNEWSRFLKMMKNDRSKMLIPCYKDMDAYELPEEFAHLQAQDMGKIGFVNDIVRGISKVISKGIKSTATSVSVENVNPAVAPLLERVFLFLEDGDWESANDYCEKVLDQDPQNATAYLGKLMVDLRIGVRSDLKNLEAPFDSNANYKKVVRFADDALKNEVESYLKTINNKTKENELKSKYQEAINILNNAKVGSYIKFGSYCQDYGDDKKDIEWLVLEVKDGKALIISKYALDCQKYNTYDTDDTWENCSLREWLNNDFINAAFSDKEKTMVTTVTVSATKNPEYKTKPGNSTKDQVFLLSITEANNYFRSSKARQCEPTIYAIAKGAFVDSGDSSCWWWLRSPGRARGEAAGVFGDGDVSSYGCDVSENPNAVRPALWIDFEVYLETLKDSVGFTNESQFLSNDNSISSTQVGSYIKFGSYIQDKDGNKKDIEWLILEVKSNKALVISKYGINCKQYNTSLTDVIWETCTLRKWLNNDFLNAAFTAEEKAKIPTVTVPAGENVEYGTRAGRATKDQVFLLSIDEADKYFSSDGARCCESTEYAEDKGSIDWWWLRSPGILQHKAAVVLDDGELSGIGCDVNEDFVVRPAMWIDLS